MKYKLGPDFHYESHRDLHRWIVDLVGPLRDWPEALRKAYTKRLTNKTRFGLYCFLRGNGCDPAIFLSYFAKRPYALTDKNAVAHLIYLWKHEKKNWTYWDMTHKHSSTLGGSLKNYRQNKE